MAELTAAAQRDFHACIDHLRGVLAAEAAKRVGRADWITAELTAVTDAANTWALGHDLAVHVTRDDVARLETTALGHVDYAAKFALRVAEHLYGRTYA